MSNAEAFIRLLYQQAVMAKARADALRKLLDDGVDESVIEKVAKGELTLIGEQGPEWVTPSRRGPELVIPTVVYNGDGSDFADAIEKALQAVRDRAPGGDQ